MKLKMNYVPKVLDTKKYTKIRAICDLCSFAIKVRTNSNLSQQMYRI